MDIFGILDMVCGLALFLYGMHIMGEGLKRMSGGKLENILEKLTNNRFKAVVLGAAVTAIIQSSSATTVMIVGFVNSGIMKLSQAAGVIMGANIGTTMTSWLLSLTGIEGGSVFVKLLKPSSFTPIMALIGVAFIMFTKNEKKQNIGSILVGFTVLMCGMDMMSAAVKPLANVPEFTNILLMFQNPIMGMIAGLVLTAVIQSSSASVGILQSLTVTGAITYNMAIPIVMGQNIGTCVTAMISAVGANKNGKRAALVHLYFNVIGVVVVLALFYIVNAFVKFTFVSTYIDMWGVALVHTVFKIICVAIIGPFYKLLEKLAVLTIRDGKESETENLLDDRLLETPAFAVARAAEVTGIMADIANSALADSLTLFDKYDPKLADEIRDKEAKADVLEDALGSYLVKLSSCDMDERDSRQITKLLHIIGDYERISDHAVNIVESAEEMRDKKIEFSPQAQHEIAVLRGAVGEILAITFEAFIGDDLGKAADVEPLEQVIDELRDKIKLNHILRLQKSECSIEHGFVLSDLLTNFERVADHCSNIAGCVIEISEFDALDMHKYLADIRQGSEGFDDKFKEYKRKYVI